jgi:hypothetical protein
MNKSNSMHEGGATKEASKELNGLGAASKRAGSCGESDVACETGKMDRSAASSEGPPPKAVIPVIQAPARKRKVSSDTALTDPSGTE